MEITSYKPFGKILMFQIFTKGSSLFCSSFDFPSKRFSYFVFVFAYFEKEISTSL